MHAVCTEMTGEVLGSRRQRLLHEPVDRRRPARRRARRPSPAMCAALSGDPLDVPVRRRLPLRPGDRASAGVGGDRLRRRTRCPTSSGATPRTLAAVAGGLGVTGGPWGDRSPRPCVLPADRQPRRRAARPAGGRAQPRTGRSTRTTAPSTSWWPASSPARWSTSARSRPSGCGRSPSPSSTGPRRPSSPTSATSCARR